jgi:S-adenosylmethionine decarboxylase proenzyme
MASEYSFFGKHYLASFLDCDPKSIINVEGLKQTMIEGIVKSGATILSYTEKIFDNNGYTILFLLSESHCSIHTYPENNALFTDLFTCGDTCDYREYQKVLIKYLKPNKVTSDLIIRDNNHYYS